VVRTIAGFASLAGLPTILAGCGGTVTRQEAIPFSHGEIELVVTSVGSALGEERYELSYDNQGERQTFFSGANFSEFDVSERDGKVALQLCRGFIDKAEPFLTGNIEGEFELVRLNLDWNCRDESREL